MMQPILVTYPNVAKKNSAGRDINVLSTMLLCSSILRKNCCVPNLMKYITQWNRCSSNQLQVLTDLLQHSVSKKDNLFYFFLK